MAQLRARAQSCVCKCGRAKRQYAPRTKVAFQIGQSVFFAGLLVDASFSPRLTSAYLPRCC
jgi:hypothetical protein